MLKLTPEIMEKELKEIGLWEEKNNFFEAKIVHNDGLYNEKNVVVNITIENIYIITYNSSTKKLVPEEVFTIKNDDITLIKITKANYGLRRIVFFNENKIIFSFFVSNVNNSVSIENIKSLVSLYPNRGIEILDTPLFNKNIEYPRSIVIIPIILFFAALVTVKMLAGDSISACILFLIGIIVVCGLNAFLKGKSHNHAKKENDEDNNNPIKQ